MANCEVCGRPTASWFSRVSHVECETVPGPWHVERGEFKSFDNQAMILLERGENCLALVKGCEIADAGRAQGGVAVAIAEARDTDDNYGGEDATDPLCQRHPENHRRRQPVSHVLQFGLAART